MLVIGLRVPGLFHVGGELEEPQLVVADAPALPGGGGGGGAELGGAGGGEGAHARPHGQTRHRGLHIALEAGERALSERLHIMRGGLDLSKAYRQK